jgi:hypothetical protein
LRGKNVQNRENLVVHIGEKHTAARERVVTLSGTDQGCVPKTGMRQSLKVADIQGWSVEERSVSKPHGFEHVAR